MTDKAGWENRYERSDLTHGARPSDFLRDNADQLPLAGVALDIASGEGRNAVFLAERGLDVIAFDFSVRALEKCKRLARERKVKVDIAALDLTDCVLPQVAFDVVVNFNYLQRDLAPALIESLKPGGVLFFETLTTDHLKRKPDFNPKFLLEPGELARLFRGLHLIKYRETDLSQSARCVASLIARKD